jgi:hypothetical protein
VNKEKVEAKKPSCCQDCEHLIKEGVAIKCGRSKGIYPDGYASWIIRVRSPDCPLDKKSD